MTNNHFEKNKKTIDMDPKEKKEEKVTGQKPETAQQETSETENVAEENVLSEDLSEQLEEANRQAEDLKDKYLRLSAEFDNYRKRTMKEKAELIKSGGEKVIASILPVLDDLERALKTIETSDDVKAMKAGVELIYSKFLKVLAENGVEKIDTENQNFDTDYHEAIALVPSPSEDLKGKILECVQDGYKLHDKVIRHAKVVVGE